MGFLSIIISLLVLTYAGSARWFQFDAWFDRLISALSVIKNKPNAHFLVSVFMPCVIVLIIDAVLGHWFWGGIELLLSVFILLYSIGRGKYKSVLRQYQKLWRDQTMTEADIHSIEKQLCGQSCLYKEPENTSVSIYGLHYKLRELIFYIGFERVFVVLFWFSLFGPVGALFYRLVSLYITREASVEFDVNSENDASHEKSIASKVLFIMEWPAARLVGLCYGVVGNFGKVMQAWMSLSSNLQMAMPLYISQIASASLNFQSQWLSENFLEARNKAELSKFAADEIDKIVALYNRSIVCMLVLVAIFEIII